MSDVEEPGQHDDPPGDQDEKKPKKPFELSEDELIVELVPDPARIRNLIVLVGYLGKNSREGEPDDGNWRLYLTPSLKDYITFPGTAVVYAKALPSGGSMVWLKRDITVQHTHIESHHLQAEFLQGTMMDNAQTSIPSFLRGSVVDGNSVTLVGCPPSISRC